MPRIIGIRDRAAAGDAIAEAVGCLKNNGVVGLPGATSYTAAALSTAPDAVARLRSQTSHTPWLGLASAEQASDIAPDLPAVVQRLIRRCWPGPLVVRTPFEAGAFNGLPEETRAWLIEQGRIPVTVPGHEITHEVHARLPAPLVLSTDAGSRPASAEALAAETTDLDLILDAGAAPFQAAASVIEVRESGFQIVSEGILSEQALRLSACRIYLFVCTGNTCRSPLAEGLFRNLLAETLQCGVEELVDRGYLVQSAGLAADAASSASPESVELLRRRGIDISQHVSQPLSEQLLNASDRVFTMTRSHRDAILRFRADLADRVEVLRRDGRDVVDPIGGGIGEYERCEQEIEGSVRAIIASLVDEEANP